MKEVMGCKFGGGWWWRRHRRKQGRRLGFRSFERFRWDLKGADGGFMMRKGRGSFGVSFGAFGVRPPPWAIFGGWLSVVIRETKGSLGCEVRDGTGGWVGVFRHICIYGKPVLIR